ncbi:MAG: kynureninase [Bacillaceae bacterium]
MEWSLQFAKFLDSKDELRVFRDEFYIRQDEIYLDGNSLGLLSKRAEKTLLELLQSWKEYGINGWTNGKYPWFYISEQIGTLMAPLVGANPNEVIVTGSITSNLHQAISTFYHPTKTKTKILSDILTFPSDIYALQSQLTLKGFDYTQHLIQVSSLDGQTLDEDMIIEQMTEDVALILLPSVLYRSGQILNMKKIAAAANERNIPIGFDLAHSIGSIPHELHKWGVDFAVWCNYKYINGGPGAVGGLFVHDKHFPCEPGLKGWFGSNKEKQFDMSHAFVPADDVGVFQIGTPHLLSMAPIIGSLSLFHEAKIERLREKSLQLTDFFLLGLKEEMKDVGFQICNPIVHEQRGGHIYLEHVDAARICKALKEKGVIPDFRAPNGIRLAPVPMYNSFEDVWRSVQILKEIMETKVYLQYENIREVIA